MIFLALWRWLTEPRQPARGIFRFWDGQRDRSEDPLEILRAVNNDSEFNPEVDPELMNAADGDEEAMLRALRCVRRAFKVKEFSQGGLLESETLDLLAQLYEFLASLKKSTSDFPTSSPLTTESSEPSTPLAEFPTKSSSDLPKTPNDPS